MQLWVNMVERMVRWVPLPLLLPPPLLLGADGGSGVGAATLVSVSGSCTVATEQPSSPLLLTLWEHTEEER